MEHTAGPARPRLVRGLGEGEERGQGHHHQPRPQSERREVGRLPALQAAEDVAAGDEAPQVPRGAGPPPDVIEERLRSDPVTSRLEDLETVRRWIEDGAGLDVGDLVVTNDGRPLQDTAREILYWLGWLPGR